MSKKNPSVDPYFIHGCGRCERFDTPECSAIVRKDILVALRELILQSELSETLKWKVPCYTFQDKNILMMGAFKDFCSINFVKGSLMNDPQNLLEKVGENTQGARWIRFRTFDEFETKAPYINDYIKEAIAVELSGKKIPKKKVEDYDVPEELTQQFKKNPELEKAFNALTPGRQKGYLLFFASAKQSKTRYSRIEKYTPQIMKGKGYNER